MEQQQQLKDVILVTSDEKSLSYKWDEKSKNLKGIQVISEDYDLENLQKEIKFIGIQSDKEQVFVKDPFDKNTYVEITKAEKHFFKNKIKNYKKIALLLGAKSFSAKAEFIEENKFTTDATGNISHTVVDIDIALKKELSSKFDDTYNLNSALNPIENFNRQRGFEEANDLVKKLNFYNEIDIVGLIENNDPTLQSREVQQNVKLELTSELNDLLEMSFKLNAMGSVFGLGASFKSTTQSVKKIILETEIIF